jgi:hypothetical protein
MPYSQKPLGIYLKLNKLGLLPTVVRENAPSGLTLGCLSKGREKNLSEHLGFCWRFEERAKGSRGLF